MTRLLIRKCPKCKGIVKVIQVDGKIEDVENARRHLLWTCGRTERGKFSEKQVVCQNITNYKIIKGFRTCNAYLLLIKFKEVL